MNTEYSVFIGSTSKGGERDVATLICNSPLILHIPRWSLNSLFAFFTNSKRRHQLRLNALDVVDGCRESDDVEAGNGCACWLHAGSLEGRSSLKGPFNYRANDEWKPCLI